jgi:hypothetical protein
MPRPIFEPRASRIYKHVTYYKGSPCILLGNPNEGVWRRWHMAPYIFSELTGVVVTLVSYSGGSRFESRPGEQSSWLKCFVGFLAPFLCQDSTSIGPRLICLVTRLSFYMSVPCPVDSNTMAQLHHKRHELLTLAPQGGQKLASLRVWYTPEERFPFCFG